MVDKNPVLIGGDGRSGTTLVSVMLDSHPDLVVLPELHFMGPTNLGPSILEVLNMLEAGDWKATTPGYQEFPEYKAPVQFVRRCQRAGIGNDELRAEVEAMLGECDSDLAPFGDRAVLIGRLGQRRAAQEGKSRWGLKIMKQIRYGHAYLSAWPSARLVHVVRDGRDVATSQILDHSWGYSTIDQAIEGWCALLGDVAQLLGEGVPIQSVRYEDVVQRPHATLGGLLDWVGLDWHDDVLRFNEMRHALLDSTVRHPSAAALRQPLYEGSIGRFVRQLPTAWVRKFTLDAEKELLEWGYEHLPRVDVRFAVAEDGCRGTAECEKRVGNAVSRLGGRYVAEAEPFEGQVRAAWLSLEGESYDAFFRRLKKMSKGIQEFRKAERIGVTYRQFDRRTFLPDIVEINTSMETRAGGRMRDAYRKSVEEMGGYPVCYGYPEEPACIRHNDVWWGAFVPSPGYTQGDVVTDEKLVAYVNFRRYGDFAFYNLILGHGEYMQYGVVVGLHLAIMEWQMGMGEEEPGRMRTLVYAGYFQGSAGLQDWKKKAGFAPGYLIAGVQRER